jgi:hypothetical protein
MILRRKASCIWVAASFFALLVSMPPAFCTEGRRPGPEAQKLLNRIRSAPGILLGYSTTNDRSLPVFEKACDKKMVILEYELADGYARDVLKGGSRRSGDDEPGAAEAWAKEPDTVVMFRWHMRHPETNDFRKGNIKDVLPGGKDHDALLKKLDYLVERIKRVKGPVIVRPWHEGNGNWFWWNGKPKEFKQLWRLTVEYVESKGCDNVLWCYSPNATADDSWQVDKFYPGDDYVDIAAIDYYFDISWTKGHIQNLDALIKSVRALEAVIPKDMPMGFGEIGPRGPRPGEVVSEELDREWGEFWKNLEPDMRKHLPRFKFFLVWSTTAFEKKLYPTSGIALAGLREFANSKGVITFGEKW